MSNSQVFHKITPTKFGTLAHVINESRIISQKPRITYHQGLVILELPHRIHEDRQYINVSLHMNFPLDSADSTSSVTPDLSLITMPTKHGGKSADYIVSAVVKYTFSHDKDILMEKLRAAITACPQIMLSITIVIQEEQEYAQPKPGSEAWSTFSHMDCLQAHTFLMYSEPEAMASVPTKNSPESTNESYEEQFELHPPMVAMHHWCNITSVTFHVWIKDDDKPIVIDGDGMARGTIYPTIDIDEVTSLINDGFPKARDSIIAYSKMVSAPSKVTLAGNDPVSIPINWEDYQGILAP
ncbi:hypothetical protein JVT61DRAFT_9947 [Boletus reticuloceps]|uniref:Uncharacterized protein n=1 Tax=Boletus reticuloceps TaxID=495285 RepID=A0A8I2YG10_9AGAM|nr:hypothetical protein JVT61DRAFT_9947 [Boletus reticuloceps]